MWRKRGQWGSTDRGSEGRGGESGEDDDGEGEETHRWFSVEGGGEIWCCA